MRRQAVHWRIFSRAACRVPNVVLPMRLTGQPDRVTCRRCLELRPKWLAMARDGDHLTLPRC